MDIAQKYFRGTFVRSISSAKADTTKVQNTIGVTITVNSVATYSLDNQSPNQSNSWTKKNSIKDKLGKDIFLPKIMIFNKLMIKNFFSLAAVVLVSIHAAVAQPTTTPKAAPKPAEAKPEGPANNEEEFQQRYNERITKDKLHGVYIPKNLDDAFVQLDKNISVESREKIKAIPEDSVDEALHNRLGRWMITNWCFYEGSRFSHYLRSAGVTYPDDMADFTVIAYHRHLHGKPVDLKELAKFYRETRKKAFEEEKKEGKVIKEEVRKRPGGGR
jgi:hypothetical protein